MNNISCRWYLSVSQTPLFPFTIALSLLIKTWVVLVFSCKYYCFVQMHICVVCSMLLKMLKKKTHETTRSQAKCLCAFTILEAKGKLLSIQDHINFYLLICFVFYWDQCVNITLSFFYSLKVNVSTSQYLINLLGNVLKMETCNVINCQQCTFLHFMTTFPM